MLNGLRQSFSQWLGQLWADLKASTDSSLLGVVRWLGLLYGPIDRHLPIDQALRKASRHRLPAHVRWKHALGSITYLLFVVLVVTGVLLLFHYRPSAQEAYPSIQHLVSDVTFGWLIRDLHVVSATLIVVVALAHLARVLFDLAYKPPRETNWLIGTLLLAVLLAFGATGYLLPWDQWAYWSVTEVLDAWGRLPLIGPPIAALFTGDDIVSGATLSRYFALHVSVLPWITFALLAFHFGLLRKHGIAAPRGGTVGTEPGIPFWPNHLLRSFATAVVVVAVLITIAVLLPRPLGDPANPYQVPDDLVTTWGPANVALAAVRYLGAWGIAGFIVLGLGLVFLPLLDRNPERGLRKQPIPLVLGALFFAALLVGWIAGRQIQTVAPTIVPASQTAGEIAAPDIPASDPVAPEPAVEP